MAGFQTLPYLVPGSGRVTAASWRLHFDGELQALGETVPHWDPGVRVEVSRLVEVDVAGVRVDCELAGDDHLRLAVVWHSTGTGLRGRGDVVDFESLPPSGPVEIGASIEGASSRTA